jgi:predicted nucleic acid-binding protein
VIHLDTSFLVDLLREAGREEAGPATLFLEKAQEEELGISVHVACELHAGAELSRNPSQERRRIERLMGGLETVYPDHRFPASYARLLAWQQRSRQRIATMDLLIATAAVLSGAPLVTRNVKDFARVPGLDLLAY